MIAKLIVPAAFAFRGLALRDRRNGRKTDRQAARSPGAGFRTGGLAIGVPLTLDALRAVGCGRILPEVDCAQGGVTAKDRKDGRSVRRSPQKQASPREPKARFRSFEVSVLISLALTSRSGPRFRCKENSAAWPCSAQGKRRRSGFTAEFTPQRRRVHGRCPEGSVRSC
jgi:hypothetical protein